MSVCAHVCVCESAGGEHQIFSKVFCDIWSFLFKPAVLRRSGSSTVFSRGLEKMFHRGL